MGCLGSKEEAPQQRPQQTTQTTAHAVEVGQKAVVKQPEIASSADKHPLTETSTATTLAAHSDSKDPYSRPIHETSDQHITSSGPIQGTTSSAEATSSAVASGLKAHESKDAAAIFASPISTEHATTSSATAADSGMPAATATASASERDKATSLVRTATHSIQTPPEDLLKDVQHLTWLGQGAYGAVYQGIWHGAYVAVKFIPSDSIDPESASFREAQLSTLLAHPNVVQAFWTRCSLLTEAFIAKAINDDRNSSSGRSPMRPEFVSGEGFGDPYGNDKGKQVFTMRDVLQQLNCKAGQYLTVIAMEYCDKGSLHQVIYKSVFKATDKWSDRIALRALIRSAREIAQGVWHLHNSGVIHGDLKPGNVLLKSSRSDRRGFVCKVSDFGLARETFGQSDIHASRWATINYMAPEHFEGLLSKASDVYSFAVVIWEMYNAERPYRDFTQGQVMMGVRTGELRPTWPPTAPKPLVTLANACLAQDPYKRPTFESIMQQLTNMEGDMRMEEYSKRNAKAGIEMEMSTAASAVSFSTPLPVSAKGQGLVLAPGVVDAARADGGGSSASTAPAVAPEQVAVNVAPQP